jgi:hypothetical protein
MPVKKAGMRVWGGGLAGMQQSRVRAMLASMLGLAPFVP